MAKITTYTIKGSKAESTTLPKDLTGDINKELMAQAVRVFEDRSHPGLSKVQSRGEVTASKKKIWKQKGTGRARHGALSAPIFVGGGKAHGPKGVKRQLSLPSKMKKKALVSALNLKLKNNELFVVSGIATVKKTKEVASFLSKIDNDSNFTVCLSDGNWKQKRFVKNIKIARVERFNDMNAYKVLFGGKIIVDKDALLSKTKEKTKKEK